MVGVGELSESKNYPYRRIIIRVGESSEAGESSELANYWENQWSQKSSESKNYQIHKIIHVSKLSESDYYLSQRIIGVGELLDLENYQSEKYRSQRIIRVGELSESGNCQSLLIIRVRELFKSANCPSLQNYCSLRTILK